MKKFFLAVVIAAAFCSTVSAQVKWANYGRYGQANAEVTVTPKAVFMGDSITDGWFSKDPGFFTSNNFLGRGISGQVTGQMLCRFRRDVIAHKPKYVVILGGINDIAGNDGSVDLEDTFGNIVSMVELAKQNKIKPVICLVFPTDIIGWRKDLGNPNDKIDTLNGWLRDYAKANKVRVIEYFSDIDKSAGRLPDSLSRDSIHPNLDGYKIMEEEIMKILK